MKLFYSICILYFCCCWHTFAIDSIGCKFYYLIYNYINSSVTVFPGVIPAKIVKEVNDTFQIICALNPNSQHTVGLNSSVLFFEGKHLKYVDKKYISVSDSIKQQRNQLC